MTTASKITGRSSRVDSAQHEVHPRLPGLLQRHAQAPWQAPLHAASQQAFEQLLALLARERPERWLLDAGCGTGQSSHRLARLYPGALVVGVDKSAHRLSRQGDPGGLIRRGDCVFLRAELASFWRLLAASGSKPERHFLLYPNPWPKAAQLQRRWHGHPVFPLLLSLAGCLEMRCNWRIYAEEFALAVSTLGAKETLVEPLPPGEPLSPFEEKYRASEHPLYRVVYCAD